MSIIDKIMKSDNKTLGEMTSDSAQEIIKRLSGEEFKTGSKLPDNIILFTGASGGTGVSTILSNVAYTALTRGLKVLVIDLNITCPVQQIFLNVEESKKESADLVSFLYGKNDLNESVVTKTKVNLLYASDRNLQDTIKCSDTIAISNFTQLIKACKRLYDVILIDCPARPDDMLCNTAMYLAECIYMVWDEGIGSASNAERLRRDMSISGIDAYTKVRAILNKRTNVAYTNYPFTKLNMEMVEVLPFTTDVIEASLRAEIFVDKGMSNSKNSSEFARRIESLTDKVLKIGGYLG